MKPRSAEVRAALEVMDAVRQVGPEAVARNLARRKPDHVIRLATTLAALVPDDQPVSVLLEWMNGHESLAMTTGPLGGSDVRMLKPCGTHAAYVRHKNRGELVDDLCRDAERRYQRSRKRQERAA